MLNGRFALVAEQWIISSFISFIFFLCLFVRSFFPAGERTNQERLPDCIFSAKNRSRFPKRCKTSPFGSLIGAALLTENAHDFLNAPKMRSGWGVQHRFARCTFLGEGLSVEPKTLDRSDASIAQFSILNSQFSILNDLTCSSAQPGSQGWR